MKPTLLTEVTATVEDGPTLGVTVTKSKGVSDLKMTVPTYWRGFLTADSEVDELTVGQWGVGDPTVATALGLPTNTAGVLTMMGASPAGNQRWTPNTSVTGARGDWVRQRNLGVWTPWEPDTQKVQEEIAALTSVVDVKTDKFVSATNLLKNGDFAAGTSQWGAVGGTLTVEDKIATATGNGGGTAISVTTAATNRLKTSVGDKVYLWCRASTPDSGAQRLGLHLYHVAAQLPAKQQEAPTAGSWYTLSGVVEVAPTWTTQDLDVRVLSQWSSTAAASGKRTQAQEVLALNLTALFGAGNEPSTPEVDAMVTELGGWFAGPVNLAPTPTVTSIEGLTGAVGAAPLAEKLAPHLPTGGDSSRKHWSGENRVILRFDDGFLNNYTLAAPYMASKGMVGYLAMCTGWVDTDQAEGRIMSAQQLVSLARDYGWEIGSHTDLHRDAIGHTAFTAGVDQASRDLLALGLPYPTTFTYPNGSRTPATDREIYLRHSIIQVTTGPEVAPVRFDAPTLFMGWTAVDGTETPANQAAQVERVKRYVRTAFRQGVRPTIAFHGIVEGTPEVAWFLSFEVFKQIIDWLHAEGYPVGLPRDVLPHNLVQDPGFNEFPVYPWGTKLANPWGVSPYADRFERVTSGQYSGLACMRLDASTSRTSYVDQGVPVTPGERYRVHALIKVAARTSGTVKVVLQPRSFTGTVIGSELVVGTIDAATSGWVDITSVVTIPSGVQGAQLRVEATDFVGEVLIDNVSMFQADLPDPLTLP